MISLVTLTLLATSHAFSIPRFGMKWEDVFQPTKYPVESCWGPAEGNFYSCNAPREVSEESCCYENKGIILQTQFWDFNKEYLNQVNGTKKRDDEDEGEDEDEDDEDADEISDRGDINKSFTIHGLWNDLCDGSYDQFCVPELEFQDSDDLQDVIVNQFGRNDLYNYMIKYWVGEDQTDESSMSLWEHEFNKHGTCFQTLLPKCFTGEYSKFQNAIAYFQKTVELFQTLPSYRFLEMGAIVPTTEKQYDLSAIETALTIGHHGKQVYVGCSNGAISEIWYYYEVKGNALNGKYRPVDSLAESKCPDKVWYLPK